MPELFKCPTTKLPRLDNVREQSSKSLEINKTLKLNTRLLMSRFLFLNDGLASTSKQVSKIVNSLFYCTKRQSEALSTLLMACDIKSLTLFGQIFFATFGSVHAQSQLCWYASVTYQARLISHGNFLAWLSLSKIQTMTWTMAKLNSLDVPSQSITEKTYDKV